MSAFGALSLLLVLLFAFGAYVRLAPTSVERWHRGSANLSPGIYSTPGGYEVVVNEASEDMFAQLDQIIRETPRTRQLAGSLGDGVLTYVTRSAIWGFPDYTTLSFQRGESGTSILKIYGRLRFGRSDLGVNQRRITSWLSALDAGAQSARPAE